MKKEEIDIAWVFSNVFIWIIMFFGFIGTTVMVAGWHRYIVQYWGVSKNANYFMLGFCYFSTAIPFSLMLGLGFWAYNFASQIRQAEIGEKGRGNANLS